MQSRLVTVLWPVPVFWRWAWSRPPMAVIDIVHAVLSRSDHQKHCVKDGPNQNQEKGIYLISSFHPHARWVSHLVQIYYSRNEMNAPDLMLKRCQRKSANALARECVSCVRKRRCCKASWPTGSACGNRMSRILRMPRKSLAWKSSR